MRKILLLIILCPAPRPPKGGVAPQPPKGGVRKAVSLVVVVLLFAITATSQVRYMVVSDKVPQHLMQRLHLIGKTTKPQLTILAFFDTRCGSCFRNLRQVQTLQGTLGHKVAFVAVSKEKAKDVAAFFTAHQELDVSYMGGDTVYSRLFSYSSVPHYVWLDDKGVVRYITSGTYLNTTTITKVLEGEQLMLPTKQDATGYNTELPLLVRDNGGTQDGYSYRSVITGYLPGVPSGLGWRQDTMSNTTRVIATNTTINRLYAHAYGQTMLPITQQRLLLRDSNSAVYPGVAAMDRTAWEMQYYHSYELFFPAANRERIRAVVLNDLDRFFGTRSTLMTEAVPCYALRKLPGAVLHTKGGSADKVIYEDSAVFINQLPYALVSELNKVKGMLPVVDETGERGRMDMVLYGRLNDVAALEPQLNKYGLTLVRISKALPILTITDNQNKN